MINLYLDIETIPSQQPWVREYVASMVTHPGQMKKPENIQKWVEEEKPSAVEEAMDKCSFDGAMNQIICIGYAVDDEPAQVLIGDELTILKDLFSVAIKCRHQAKYIGHNIVGFDLRVIKQRSIVLGYKPPAAIPFDAKPWDNIRVFDTMTQWDGQNKVRLDKLARAFGIKGKTTDGSQVYQMWKDGKHQEIADYCKEDVELTRKVYKQMSYGN